MCLIKALLLVLQNGLTNLAEILNLDLLRDDSLNANETSTVKNWNKPH